MTWISDGDTVDVETTDGRVTVRLVGINAPDQGECFADEGLDHLIETLKGERVALEVLGTDQFDRTLAHVFTSDRHINLEMVETGLAIGTSPTEGDPHGEAILAAEEAAFENGVGLWSATACGHGGSVPAVEIDVERSVTDPPGADDEALGAERLVVVNTGTDSIDLDGWILRDESTRHRFVFGARPGDPVTQVSILEPGERIGIASDDSGWDPGGSPVWNNSGDMAILQLPDGTVVDRWRY